MTKVVAAAALVSAIMAFAREADTDGNETIRAEVAKLPEDQREDFKQGVSQISETIYEVDDGSFEFDEEGEDADDVGDDGDDESTDDAG